MGWLISFTYRRLIANPDPPLPARGEPQWAEARRSAGAQKTSGNPTRTGPHPQTQPKPGCAGRPFVLGLAL